MTFVPRFRRIARALLSALVATAVVPVAALAPAPQAAMAAPVTTAGLYAVDFVDANVGYAAGANGVVVKTVNGGASWTQVRSGGGHEFRGIGFASATDGWVVSLTGRVFGTTNGGTSWSELSADIADEFYVGEKFYSFARLSASEGIAFGGFTDSPGVGLHSYNFGNGSWLSGGTSPELWAGTYEPSPEQPPFPKLGLGEFYGADFISSTKGWAVGHDRYQGTPTPANAPIIWNYDRSRGSGSNAWARQTVTGTGPLYDVDFASANNGVAVGSAGKVYRTVNGGSTWTADSVGTADSLWGVELTTGNQAWAVGASGRIFRSTDGGDNWTMLTSPTGYQLEDIEWLGDNTAVAVGASGAIVKTTNGTTWTLSNDGVGTPVAPVMNTLTSSSHPSESAWVKNADVAAAWTASATSPATIAGYGVILDQSNSTVPSVQTTTQNSGTYTAASSGTFWLHVRAKDSTGAWSNTLHRQVKVDVTAPTPSFTPNPAGYAGSASIPLTASDPHSGVASVSYRVNGGDAVTTAGSSASVVISSVGNHEVTYWATDNVGNVAGETTKQVTVTEAVDPYVPEPVAVAGAGRYATAIESAKLVFDTPMAAGPDGNKWVVIASGTNWPDALAASGLAGALDAPLLLTTPDDLRGEVATYITQLGANRAAIVGGEAAVSAEVASDLAALVGGSANVKRYGAGSRYATAELIATKTVGVPGRSTWDTYAFVATGGNFPDALAAAPLSAFKGRPLYLAHPTNGISDATISAMKSNGVTRVFVLGGVSAVSSASVAKLNANGITVGGSDRWSGTDRYDTARVIAEKSIAEGLSPRFTGLATGTNFPDALAGGVAQGLSGSVLVLTSSTALSPAANTYLVKYKGQIEELRFFGGTAAVSTAVRQAAITAATP